MTTHRRRGSRGRRLAAIAAVVMIAGCLLPWHTFAGDLPVSPFRAFDGSGILVFVGALATLALVAFPYAAGEAAVAVDRWLGFALIFGVALLGIVLWPFQVLDEPAGLLPHRAPGFWLASIGVAMLGWAAVDIARESAPR